MASYLVDTVSRFCSYTEGDSLMFTNLSFWAFFTVLLFGYSFVYQRINFRSFYLLIFSLFFYFKSSGLFFILLLFSTLVDYALAILIAKSQNSNWSRFYVGLSVTINLLVLSYFKYAYFWVDTINLILGTNLTVVNHLALWANSLTGSNFDSSTIFLPVGISFYTFQTISYTVDVYRGKVAPISNIIDFAFYVSFFPQLVAGPIVRAAEFIPQIYRKYSLTRQEFGHAIFLILAGLIKKMIISDYLSVNYVDRIFDNPLSYTGFENLMAMYGYALQIYSDFSGYTDIAIGLALLLGFRLPINFNSPYKATSLTDFWHRWHISLSSWLRDYLYIPLGGNRKGRFRTYLNLMVTMLLGGLWHGAHLKFVVWGGIHGLGLAVEKAIGSLKKTKIHHSQFLFRFAKAVITFHIVCFAWIFFRAADFSAALDMLWHIVFDFGANLTFKVIAEYKNIFGLMLIGFILHWFPVSIKERARGAYIALPFPAKVLVALVLVVLIIQFRTSELQPFIYFRF